MSIGRATNANIGSKFSQISTVFWLYNAGEETPVGLNIGFTHALEHELGYKNVLDGIGGRLSSSKESALEERTINPDKNMMLIKGRDKSSIMIFSSSPMDENFINYALSNIPQKKQGLFCKWGPNHILVYGKGEDSVRLNQFFDAVLNNQVLPLHATESPSLFPSDKVLLTQAGTLCFVDSSKLTLQSKKEISDFVKQKNARQNQVDGLNQVAARQNIKAKFVISSGSSQRLEVVAEKNSPLNSGFLFFEQIVDLLDYKKANHLVKPEFKGENNEFLSPEISFSRKVKNLFKVR